MKFFLKYALGIGVLAYWSWGVIGYLSFQPFSSGFEMLGY